MASLKGSITVFPTQVGLILFGLGNGLMAAGIPHASGGDPEKWFDLGNGL
jgi:hypothetical protein